MVSLRRFRFLPLALFLAAWLLVITLPPTTGAQPSPPPPVAVPSGKPDAPIRGVWMTANDMKVLRDGPRLGEAIHQLSDLHFNTIYPVVWNAGYAYYPSEVTKRRKIQTFTMLGLQRQDILADVISRGHAEGLLVVPWFEFGFMAPPSSELATRHPQWLTQKQDGGKTSISAAGEVVWLNPFHPEVQAFITEMVMEVISKYDGDGIQFDDHMSLPVDFGYDSYTMALYKKETKKDPPSNPKDAAWMTWRANKITTFMESLKQQVREVKPKAIMSISPNYYDFAYKLQLQDWLAWVRQGIADEIIVQLYRPDLASFDPELNRPEISESQQKIPTAVGIMSGLRHQPVTMSVVDAQVRATQRRGLGVCFFYFESLWTTAPESPDTRLAALQQMFPAPAPRRSR